MPRQEAVASLNFHLNQRMLLHLRKPRQEIFRRHPEAMFQPSHSNSIERNLMSLHISIPQKREILPVPSLNPMHCSFQVATELVPDPQAAFPLITTLSKMKMPS